MIKPAILVVDDEPEVLRAVSRDLRHKYGGTYRVLRAESGAMAMAALRELRQRDEPVALLLSDQRMPGMDGVTFLAEARLLFPNARRALLTAYADTTAAIASINQSQIDYYLLKPWDPPQERLFPVIDDLLDGWRADFKPGFGGAKLIGHRWSPHTHELRSFLARNQVPYEFLEAADSPAARDILALLPPADRDFPLVLLPGGKRLVRPQPDQLARELGMSTQANAPFYDVVFVGAGPAGLASAVYAASEGLKCLMIEREAPGGQAGTSNLIENYLGFPAGLSGSELARRATAQARRFGVEILTPAEALRLEIDGPYRRVRLASGASVACHVLMLCMGVSWRTLGARDAGRFTGRGVYYGAAGMDAASCANCDVYVVGAGNSAGQAAMHLAENGARVNVVMRGDSLAEKMSQYLVDRIRNHPRISVHARHEVAACSGGEKLEAITLRHMGTGAESATSTQHLFVFIGAAPNTGWLGNAVKRDRHGFIVTGPDLEKSDLRDWPLARAPFLLESSVPGVFAAGDVRAGSVKRVASAVGEGSVCVSFMHQHLAEL
ncbi:MAG: FAD-dependent oxidoreductase [Planctomycetes bacterium]|nr:FAD-dependent oxidoreductase [Planctomycetota bacterium]